MPTAHHIGKAGHLAVMAELSNRGYNVAIPEIDIGDDIFVVNDGTGIMWRLQVKTSVATKRRSGYSGQFRVRRTAITTPYTPDMHFVFALRLQRRFRFVVLSRQVLENYVTADGMGSPSTVSGVDWVNFYVRLDMTSRPATAHCGTRDISHHLEAWSTWPVV